MSQTFAKEKPSALYLVDQSEIRGRIPLEKRREANAVGPSSEKHYIRPIAMQRVAGRPFLLLRFLPNTAVLEHPRAPRALLPLYY